MAGLMSPATAETAPKQLFQTPQRNSPETVPSETTETIAKQACNKAKQHRNNDNFALRNSETSPYRGGETVSPLARTLLLSALSLRRPEGSYASRSSSRRRAPNRYP
jgi:hypothetical protein